MDLTYLDEYGRRAVGADHAALPTEDEVILHVPCAPRREIERALPRNAAMSVAIFAPAARLGRRHFARRRRYFIDH